MSSSKPLPVGGVVHTYQRFDPKNFPPPTQPPSDVVSPAMEHLLQYGSTRRLTPEELARAIHIDPSMIQGLGPSLEALRKLLEERKKKILETYETSASAKEAESRYSKIAENTKPPKKLRDAFRKATSSRQYRDVERLWYAADRTEPAFAKTLLHLMQRLGDVYQVEELIANYDFTGRQAMTVEKALEVKEELEEIDRLLEQLKEAEKNAQIAIIDMEALAEFVEQADVDHLRELQRLVEQYQREALEQAGIENKNGRLEVTPQAMRVFQGKLLERIFAALKPSRTGRHRNDVKGEGAVETQKSKPYEFGDSVSQMDIPQSFINSLVREPGTGFPIRLTSDDIEIHVTRNTPKAATCVVMDMSGSMRYDGQYVNVKRMALALEGLIRREYPGDRLSFLEMYSFAKPCANDKIIELMPKPVTLYDPIVRLRADMADPNITESAIPPHFTNIQHALQLSRRMLAAQDTPNKQIVLITDGLPTAHFEGTQLYLLYPADPRTEEATLREGRLCAREGITINLFLIPSWSQSEEDVRFAYRLAESTKGRVFFTAGKDLDRFVLWDYVERKREILS